MRLEPGSLAPGDGGSGDDGSGSDGSGSDGSGSDGASDGRDGASTGSDGASGSSSGSDGASDGRDGASTGSDGASGSSSGSDGASTGSSGDGRDTAPGTPGSDDHGSSSCGGLRDTIPGHDASSDGCSSGGDDSTGDGTPDIVPNHGDVTDGPPPVDEVCKPTTTTLYAGQTLEAGTITVETQGDELVVKVVTSGDWLLGALHVYAGSGPVPTTPGGNVAPGSFPYAETYSPKVASATIRIPLDELGAACGDPLVMALHAEVSREGESGTQTETGWGYGIPFEGAQWGWSFDTSVCCEDTYGCTYTQGFWKTHPDAWPVTTLALGGIDYSQAELLALFATAPEGDASIILVHQLVAAELNAATGATLSSEVQAARDAAHAWLAAHAINGVPAGVHASSAEGAIATALASVLRDYNEGWTGTPHCD